MINKVVLAVVGKREITQNDVDMLIKGMDPKSAAQFHTEEGKKTLLQELINQELLYLAALENGIQNTGEYKAELERAKVTILKQLAMTKLLNRVSVQESEALDFYNRNKELFKSPDSVKASHILLASEKEALDLAEEINAGLSFEFAARKYSICPSKEEGGNLGYFIKENMVPEFSEKAFSMEIGEISQPVKTKFGYHIIKVVDKKPGDYKTFEEVRNSIYQQLLLKKQQELYIKETSDLKKKYKVKTYNS